MVELDDKPVSSLIINDFNEPPACLPPPHNLGFLSTTSEGLSAVGRAPEDRGVRRDKTTGMKKKLKLCSTFEPWRNPVTYLLVLVLLATAFSRRPVRHQRLFGEGELQPFLLSR